MYSFLPKFTSEISYQSISLQKNKLASGQCRVECCIANTVFKYWNGIVPGYIHEMFKPSLCTYSTRSQMTLDIPLRKTNTGQKSLSFLRPQILSKIGPCIKNVRTSSSSMHAIKKNIFFICKTNLSYYHLMIDIIIWFSHSNVISSCNHWYPFKSSVIF